MKYKPYASIRKLLHHRRVTQFCNLFIYLSYAYHFYCSCSSYFWFLSPFKMKFTTTEKYLGHLYFWSTQRCQLCLSNYLNVTWCSYWNVRPQIMHQQGKHLYRDTSDWYFVFIIELHIMLKKIPQSLKSVFCYILQNKSHHEPIIQQKKYIWAKKADEDNIKKAQAWEVHTCLGTEVTCERSISEQPQGMSAETALTFIPGIVSTRLITQRIYTVWVISYTLRADRPMTQKGQKDTYFNAF